MTMVLGLTMLDYLLALCATDEGLYSAFRTFDVTIALAYFSIPVSTLWVFRRRSEDLPYPMLWIAFVGFIFACGTTHALHAIAPGLSGLWLSARTALQLITAVISVVTAVALNLALPKIAKLPSPRQQQIALKTAVIEATRERSAVLLQLHHRVGNQLAKMGAMVRLELRIADPAAQPSLLRIQELLEALGEEHHKLSLVDYLNMEPAITSRAATLPLRGGSRASPQTEA